MIAQDVIPVTILSGYLGAGKTTLLNHVLATVRGRRMAVLVNDFGAINVDASLIADRGADTITLSNGCVCCTIEDDLGAALGAQLRRFDRPDHILIEASGVAEPARMLRYATGHPGLSLGGIVTLADAARVETRVADKFVGRLVARQLKAAHVVIANKIDLVDVTQLDRVRGLIGSLAPDAIVVETRNGEIDPELLLSPLALGPHALDGPDGRVQPVSFHSVSVAFPAGIDTRTLERLLACLPPTVHRVKGFVCEQRTGTRMLVQAMGGGALAAITHCEAAVSAPLALVAIGTSADDIEVLGRTLRQCAEGAGEADPTLIQANRP